MRVLVCFLTVAQFLIVLPQCRAQNRAPGLELIAAPVEPGAPIFVNALLSNPSGARVLVIRENIQFPREKLVFVQARLGIVGDLAGAVMSLEMKDKSGAKVKDREAAQTLEVTITAKKTFSDGPLIEFQFRLADAKEQSIRLAHKADALDDQGKKIAGFTFADAEVAVTKDVAPPATPVLGCFFFTH